MNIRIVQIIVIGEKAYVPSNAVYPSGIFTSIEPVWIGRPILEELVPVVEAVLSTEPTRFASPTPEEIKKQRDLLPRITGARSWKRLGQMGIDYAVTISEKGIFLDMSRLDSKGRWVFDSTKEKRYPLGTDLSIVIGTVLDDLASREM